MTLAAAAASIVLPPALEADDGTPTRAMWVYKTETLLRSASARAELLEFCAPRRIADLFFDTHFQAKAKSGPYEIADAAALKTFLGEATAKRIRIHALAGDPSHVRRENHAKVLARVDAFAAFNEGAAANGRFAGLHFDIEPHALPVWHGASDAEKSELLTQFVELNAKVVERLHDRAPGTIYGADVAFWLDKVNDDGSPAYPVTYRGVTSDATRHLLGLVDHLALMSYRGTVEGKNAIIALVARAIAAADEAKGRIFVGVKMADIGPRNESFFGRTEQQMEAALSKVDTAYAGHRGYAGIAYFMYSAFKEMPR